MKYIKTFEFLGIADYLLKLVEDVKFGLSNNNEFRLETNIRGKDIIVDFELSKNKEKQGGLISHSYFQVIDADKFEFFIKLGDLKTTSILHELKHLDRVLRRDLKTDSFFYLNHVGRDVTLKYRHLLYSKHSDDVLIQSLYLINVDEFEAYYHEMYAELKDMVTDDMTNIQKRKIISDYLSDSGIYNLYKFFKDRGGFNLEDFFKDEWSLNEYLKILEIKINQFYENRDSDYEKWNTVLHKIKYFINKFKTGKKIEVNSLSNEINRMFNKVIYNGLKKFDRLYSIFL